MHMFEVVEHVYIYIYVCVLSVSVCGYVLYTMTTPRPYHDRTVIVPRPHQKSTSVRFINFSKSDTVNINYVGLAEAHQMFIGVGLQYIHMIHVHPIDCLVQCDSRVGPAEESSHLNIMDENPLWFLACYPAPSFLLSLYLSLLPSLPLSLSLSFSPFLSLSPSLSLSLPLSLSPSLSLTLPLSLPLSTSLPPPPPP